MKKYEFQPGEHIIIESDMIYLSTDEDDNITTENVMLTNLHLIAHIEKRKSNGLFKKPTITQNIRSFPLTEIKILNGQANIVITKEGDSIDLYFARRKETLSFFHKKETKIWASAINEAVTGEPIEFGWRKKKKMSDAKSSMTGKFKDTANSLRETVNSTFDDFNISEQTNSDSPTQENQQPKQLEVVTKYCTSCGSPLAGHRGSIVFCGYCQNEQTL